MPINKLKPRTASISSSFTFVQLPMLSPNTCCAYPFVSLTIVVSTAVVKKRGTYDRYL